MMMLITLYVSVPLIVVIDIMYFLLLLGKKNNVNLIFFPHRNPAPRLAYDKTT